MSVEKLKSVQCLSTVCMAKVRTRLSFGIIKYEQDMKNKVYSIKDD